MTERSLSGLGEWKPTPEIKVLEALGCIADDRIRLTEDGAEVISSDGTRKYKVVFDGESIGSTDNGTRFRGYMGYPIIAYLMVKGLLPYDEKIAQGLKGFPWRRLNEKYKRYWIVEKIALKRLEERGVEEKRVKEFVRKVLGKLKDLGLRRKEI